LATAEAAYRRTDEVLLVLVSEAMADVPSFKNVLEAQQQAQAVMKENIKRLYDELRRQGALLKAKGIDQRAPKGKSDGSHKR